MDMDVLDLIARRRTIRRYTDEPVSNEQRDALVQAAFYAPNYLNRRPFHFLVLQDKELQDRLGAILGVRPYVQQAALAIVLLGDDQISNTWDIDLAAAAENILIAATGMGLGGAWVGNPRGAAWDAREDEIRELLDIPDDIRIFGLITVGHPDESKPAHSPLEWDPTRVHYNSYNELRPENPLTGEPLVSPET